MMKEGRSDHFPWSMHRREIQASAEDGPALAEFESMPLLLGATKPFHTFTRISFINQNMEKRRIFVNHMLSTLGMIDSNFNRIDYLVIKNKFANMK